MSETQLIRDLQQQVKELKEKLQEAVGVTPKREKVRFNKGTF